MEVELHRVTCSIIFDLSKLLMEGLATAHLKQLSICMPESVCSVFSSVLGGRSLGSSHGWIPS